MQLTHERMLSQPKTSQQTSRAGYATGHRPWPGHRRCLPRPQHYGKWPEGRQAGRRCALPGSAKNLMPLKRDNAASGEHPQEHVH